MHKKGWQKVKRNWKLPHLFWRTKARLIMLSQTEKIFERRLQGSKLTLKRYLMKINIWQNKFIPYPVSRAWQWYRYLLLFICLNKCTRYYRCLLEEGERSCFFVIPTKRWRYFEKMFEQASRCRQKTCNKSCGSMTCYCGKRWWCHFKFSWQSFWVCCWTCTGFSWLTWRDYWGMVDVKSEKIGVVWG